MSDLHYNPFDPEIRRDPYPTYARLRAEAPVFEAPGLGLFVVSRHRDVTAVLRDAGSYSSSAFGELFSRVNTTADRAEAVRGETPTDSGPASSQDQFAGALLDMDPPDHTRLRKIVNRGFTRSRIAALAPRVAAIAADLLDELGGEREWDLVGDFAAPLPSAVIAELLGIEPERRVDFRRWSDALLLAATGMPGEAEQLAMGEAILELGDYLDGLIERRRRFPEADLVSALVCADAADQEVLGAETIVRIAAVLLVAGNETTSNLITNAMLALLAHPQELARVLPDPARIPAMLEEALRYDSPLQLTLRRTTRTVEIAGTSVPEGATLACLIGSANRDPATFAEPERFDPERFDPGRQNVGHLAFGLGHHFCLGAPLARLEAKLAFEALFARYSNFELGAGEIPYTPSFLVRGVTRLPIRCRPIRERGLARVSR